MAYDIAKHKLFSGSECVDQCVRDVLEAVCPENKTAFENVSLFRTTVCHMGCHQRIAFHGCKKGRKPVRICMKSCQQLE
jgi:hypothetical protein